MRVTEALIRQNNQERMKRNRKNDAEEEEETQTYKERNLEWWSINQNQSAFASPMENGINHNKSVFDQQAVFRTKEG